MEIQRHGGRKMTDSRALNSSLEGLARVDGSARFAFGSQTAALASISGPIEVRIAAENPSAATFEVILRPISNVPATQSKSLASSIRSALIPSLILSQNPRTLIQLVIQALSPSRTQVKSYDVLVAAMINASTLALLNAGSVPMKGVVCAVAVGRTDSVLIVDPDDAEQAALDASGVFAFAFADGVDDIQCVWTNWRTSALGSFDESELEKAQLLASGAAKSVWLHILKTFEGRTEVAIEA